MKIKLHGTVYDVTPEMIAAVLADYDSQYRHSADDAGRGYILIHDGRSYPPKRIMKLALGPTAPLNGGEGRNGANTILRALGFVVEPRGNQSITAPAHQAKPKADERLEMPPATMDELLSQLFAQHWVKLHDQYLHLPDGNHPGVYVLACSTDDFTTQLVAEPDIYYVGMSQTSLRGRLSQFVRGLEDGKHHSGAKHHFNDVGMGIPYAKLSHPATFYVAAVAIPCISVKEHRGALDLRKLGEVARLEYYALARIKEKVGQEPKLNRK